VLAGCTDADRLRRTRDVLLLRAALPEAGALGRALRRCGVPDHVRSLLAATSSLRRSWLAGIVLVLAVVVAASHFAVGYGDASSGTGHPYWAAASAPGWSVLGPFLIIAPLLPLAAVAAAFSPGLDPAYWLASAAPVSKIWLLCVRSVAVIAATLAPAALAALALPGPAWLAAALLLPALAVSATAIAVATVLRPAAAVVLAAGTWAGLVLGIAIAAATPVSVIGVRAQLIAAGVLLISAGLIAIRRQRIDYGWLG
jgi:hypothetical protein